MLERTRATSPRSVDLRSFPSLKSSRKSLCLRSFKLSVVQLKSTLGTPYEDMLFFDDEHGNIRQVSLSVNIELFLAWSARLIESPTSMANLLDETDTCVQVSKLGVTSILVSTGDGLSLRAFEQGLKLYAKSKES